MNPSNNPANAFRAAHAASNAIDREVGRFGEKTAVGTVDELSQHIVSLAGRAKSTESYWRLRLLADRLLEWSSRAHKERYYR